MYDEKMLTTGEVAKILNVSKGWFEYHRWKGDGIPFVRLGTRTVRYRLSEVKAWIEAQTKTNTVKSGVNYAN